MQQRAAIPATGSRPFCVSGDQMRNQLVDVDIDGVHLVKSPANRRRWALTKSAPPEAEDTMKLTKAEFTKRIATEVEGEIPEEKLVAIAKAIGIELTDGPADKAPVKKAAEAEAEDKDEKGGSSEIETALAKKSMGKVVDALSAVAKRLEQLEAKTTAKEAAELAKRIGVLNRAGVKIEKDADAPVVEAAEKAMEAFFKRLDQVGITKAFGDPRQAEPAPTLVGAIHKEVRRVLGREPIGKMEEIRVKHQIYQANPGLLSTVPREQRDGRAA
jgi:DNA-binding XRE family transcriptional regulator